MFIIPGSLLNVSVMKINVSQTNHLEIKLLLELQMYCFLLYLDSIGRD